MESVAVRGGLHVEISRNAVDHNVTVDHAPRPLVIVHSVLRGQPPSSPMLRLLSPCSASRQPCHTGNPGVCHRGVLHVSRARATCHVPHVTRNEARQKKTSACDPHDVHFFDSRTVPRYRMERYGPSYPWRYRNSGVFLSETFLRPTNADEL